MNTPLDLSQSTFAKMYTNVDLPNRYQRLTTSGVGYRPDI